MLFTLPSACNRNHKVVANFVNSIEYDATMIQSIQFVVYLPVRVNKQSREKTCYHRVGRLYM